MAVTQSSPVRPTGGANPQLSNNMSVGADGTLKNRMDKAGSNLKTKLMTAASIGVGFL